jgi:hypothetical protein
MTVSLLQRKNYEKFDIGRQLSVLDYDGKSTGQKKFLWEINEYNRFLGNYQAFKDNEKQNLSLALKNLRSAVRAFVSNYSYELDSVPLVPNDLDVMIDTAADLLKEANSVSTEDANGSSIKNQKYLQDVNNYLHAHTKVLRIDKDFLDKEIEEAAKEKAGGSLIKYLVAGGYVVGAIIIGGLAFKVAIVYFSVKVSLAIGVGGGIVGGEILDKALKTIQYQKQEAYKELLKETLKLHRRENENSHVIDSSFFQKTKDLIEPEAEPRQSFCGSSGIPGFFQIVC